MRTVSGPARRAGIRMSGGHDSATEFDHLVSRIARRKVQVRIGGEVQEMSTLEATLTATFQAAGKGNSHAAWIAIEAARRADERIAAETQSRRAAYSELKQCQRHRIAAAGAAGLDATLILPHPDDIDPDHPAGPRIIGPINADEWSAAQKTVRLRDAWLVQHALDHVRAKGRRAPLHEPGDSLSMATLAEMSLPRRLQRGQDGMVGAMMRLSSLPIRDLLKLTRRAWAAAGQPLPRGATAPSPALTLGLMTLVAGAINEVLAEGFDARNVGAVAENLLLSAGDMARDHQDRDASGEKTLDAPRSPRSGSIQEAVRTLGLSSRTISNARKGSNHGQ